MAFFRECLQGARCTARWVAASFAHLQMSERSGMLVMWALWVVFARASKRARQPSARAERTSLDAMFPTGST
eukprot:5641372-Pyramimonas_sp.AAC.1